MSTADTTYVDAALTTLEAKVAPLTVAFLPSSLVDRPDSDSASLRGQTFIATEADRQKAISTLSAMKSQAVPA